jgi:hypothetical protein
MTPEAIFVEALRAPDETCRYSSAEMNSIYSHSQLATVDSYRE